MNARNEGNPDIGTKLYHCELKKSNKKLANSFKACTEATNTILILGMYVGWLSPITKRFQEHHIFAGLTQQQESMMIGITYVGSIISSLPAGFLMDRFGRKVTLILTVAEGLLGWAILITTDSLPCIYLARLLGGMVGGTGYAVVPIYLSEIAEPKVRGSLNSITNVLLFVGIFFEYSIGSYVSYEQLNMISCFFPIVQLVMMFYIPESPYFYAMKGNKRMAVNTIAWLKSLDPESTTVENELNSIQKTISISLANKANRFEIVQKKENRRALIIVQFLAIVQRLSGSVIILSYCASTSPSLGILNSNQIAMIMCALWIFLGFFSTSLVDRIGRKPLLIFSCAGIGLGLGLYGYWHSVLAKSTNGFLSSNVLPFTGLFIYSITYPLGVATIPNLIQGEMFAPNIKGFASAISSITLALTSLISAYIFYPITSMFGLHMNFYLFSLISFLGAIFTIFFVLETKGKTLYEIQLELARTKSQKGNFNGPHPTVQ